MTAIYGHRGAMGVFPENTLPSFEEALSNGVDGIELDVQLTKDHQFVVMHDPTVDRTTNGTGHVKDKTVKELKELSAGIPFTHLDNYCEADWKGITVPTLAEALELMAPYQIEVNIELKPNLSETEGIEKLLLDSVRPFQHALTLNYSSFHLPLIQRLRQLDKNIELAWLVKHEIPYPADYLATNRINLYHLSKKLALKERSTFDEEGLVQQSRIWTVNEPEEVKGLLKKKVKAIMTDFPEMALRIRKQQGNI
ncbi:glycerophosphodiester phosphodiesterase family protein [Shouchella lehensis]|uniref:Glycerophosphodiester phosphodiesterase n=1 Tax=Shouchella lehensis TaxID=300825 RepID=A0A4Y7WM10_9BACI|nr:glycerophosphodiester phosphodiesterase family protein [Shouchella lehensis]TES49334.1 glycerophosphodiester phosphodiesterase [Shouchella lehensis]